MCLTLTQSQAAVIELLARWPATSVPRRTCPADRHKAWRVLRRAHRIYRAHRHLWWDETCSDHVSE